jgi:uncharacterized Zn finger protein
MSVQTVLTRLLPGGGAKVVVECRNCGTAVSRELPVRPLLAVQLTVLVPVDERG